MVRERKAQYQDRYRQSNILGSCLCILSLIPLFLGIMINEENELLMVMMLSLMLVLIGAGVFLFVQAGIVWASFEKLLQEGDYTKEKKTAFADHRLPDLLADCHSPFPGSSLCQA